MKTLQTSQVFSQRYWPKVGDIDDCWCLSGLQCVHACAPWLPLPNITEFRAAAGDPDDGIRDGGDPDQIELYTAIRKLYPTLPNVQRVVKGTIVSLQTALRENRPVSIALDSSKLPDALRFNFNGLHQATLTYEDAMLWIANPLAPPHSAWLRTSWSQMLPTLEAYAGAGRFSGVIFPTMAEALITLPMVGEALDSAADAATAAWRRGYDAAAGEIRDAAEQKRLNMWERAKLTDSSKG